jgi:hypothetical protein
MNERAEQLERFRQATERKAQAAEVASHNSRHGRAPATSGHPESGHSPREQGHGKDKMTADRWNH